MCHIGADQRTLSSRSLEAGAILPDDLPSGVLNLRVRRLKELPRDATQFIDPSPLASKTVYYQVVSEDSRKRSSRNPGTVGLYVE